MKHKRKDLIDVIVNRRTKGTAFFLDSEQYWKNLEEIELAVTEDFESMDELEFREKYKNYLW